MAKKKKEAGRKAAEEKAEGGPQFMVQVSDPRMVRKDLLETLREIIIFMQGYEKFRQIQDEKVAIFRTLKDDVREFNLLIDHKLRKLLPKGNLKTPAGRREFEEELEEGTEEMETEVKAEKVPVKEPKSELDALESQLREIEGQLRKVQ